MKVAIVSSSEEQGGAARAALRLHLALREAGVESYFFVQEKSSDRHSVIGSSTAISRFLGKLRPSFEPAIMKIMRVKASKIFSLSWLSNRSLVEQINSLEPDIVHLHWVNRGMLGLNDLLNIKAPIVWSLHDMWPFTGGCHYDDGCAGFLNQCCSCPQLTSPNLIDLAKKNFNKKKKIYERRDDITVVGLSNWISEQAKSSSLMKNVHIETLPNPIDISVFKGTDCYIARRVLNLPVNKKLLMYSAMSALSDERKGYVQLMESIERSESEYDIVVLGSEGEGQEVAYGHSMHFLGTLKDDFSLSLAYSAVDLVAVPSLQENLSNTIMESLSCGTPVVAFNIGGNADMIDESNGFLAKPYDADDFANGIDALLEEENLAVACRQGVEEKFEMTKVSQKYVSLYREVMSKSS